MIRTIAGKNIAGDTVNNSKNRYIEINLDPYKKELKIVSRTVAILLPKCGCLVNFEISHFKHPYPQ